MKGNTVILTIFFVSLCIISVFAQNLSLKAEVDKTTITTDETLTYKLTITSLKKQIPHPELPKFTGFSVLSSAQTSNISVGAGKLSTSLVYVYILTPNDTGKFKIESSHIKIKDRVYSSEEFEIEVTPGKIKPKTKSEPPLPEEYQPESEVPQITL